MVNRIEEWETAKSNIGIGATLNCVVVRHEPFGLFVSVENTTAVGLIERVRLVQDGYSTPTDFPQIGSHIKATVLGFRDYSQQIELAIPRKGNTPERPISAEAMVEVGLRIGVDGQLNFFGVEEINQMLASGKSVQRIEKGDALVVKSGESADRVKIQLTGFSVKVIVADRCPERET